MIARLYVVIIHHGYAKKSIINYPNSTFATTKSKRKRYEFSNYLIHFLFILMQHSYEVSSFDLI